MLCLSAEEGIFKKNKQSSAATAHVLSRMVLKVDKVGLYCSHSLSADFPVCLWQRETSPAATRAAEHKAEWKSKTYTLK